MINSLKRSAEELFKRITWPRADEEDWRRTDLTRLLPRGILDSNANLTDEIQGGKGKIVDSLSLPEGYAGRIVSENGVVVGLYPSEPLTDAGFNLQWLAPGKFPETFRRMGEAELNESEERITAWHYRDMPGCLVLELNGSFDKPVLVEEHLVSGDSGSVQKALSSLPHLHIVATSNTRGGVIWSLEGIPEHDKSVTPIINGGITASISPGARLDVTLRQNLGTSIAAFLHGRFDVEEGANLEFRESHFGAALLKTRTRVSLGGRGANAQLNGVYVAGEGRHYDIGTIQEHRAAHTTSNALYKGAVANRAIFQGLINVWPHAAKTDAYLTNNNLILSAGARSDSLPKLNILTDNVKCSHGSTTGRLDKDQIFYLGTRGYSPEQAVRELISGFLLEAFTNAPAPARGMFECDINAVLSASGLWVDG